MKNNATEYQKARDMLLDIVKAVYTEKVPLEKSYGRVLAEEIKANVNVPEFDRSPLDGYALRSEDTLNASKEDPVTLKILEEVPCGALPSKAVVEGTAVKILTGAPIPEGADSVVMFEKTHFTAETVEIFSPIKHDENIIHAGEDVKKGTVLATKGMIIDAGIAGTLAAQGVMYPHVFAKPAVGIISTGSELLGEDEEAKPGKIRNTNRYMLTAALENIGCIADYVGTAKDSAEEIEDLINIGLTFSDAIILTGGVSVGDYDLTPAAMERAGVEILVRGVALKPGMACALGHKNGKLVCALSGNPASSLTTYFSVVQPCLQKLAGFKDYIPKMFDIVLQNDFPKASKGTRMIRGRLVLEDDKVTIANSKEQGNVVISSMIGNTAMAVVPAGSGPLKAGTVLKGFLI